MMYAINVDSREPIMVIDRQIGGFDDDGIPGISGAEFARELMYLDGLGKDRIQVWINSPGGNVMEGYNIYNAILRSTTKVDTYCIGIAASIAAVIFQAGRNRIMNEYGVLMYHNPFGSDSSDAITAIRNSVIKMICGRSGMDEKKCGAMMDRETFIDALESKGLGLCDIVETSAGFNKKRLSPVGVENNAAGYYKDAKNIFNSLLTNKNPKKMPDFSKIANKLDLIDEASESAILKQIEKMENRATTAETALADVRKQLTTKDNEIARLNGIINQANQDKAAAEANAARVEVTAIVNQAAELGKIKNDADTKNRWIERGIKDKEGVTADLEGIPVNKTAVKIQNQTSTGGTVTGGADLGGIKNAAAIAMAQVQNKLGVK